MAEVETMNERYLYVRRWWCPRFLARLVCRERFVTETVYTLVTLPNLR